MTKNPKLAGQTLNVNGERAILLGETLAYVLDQNTWEQATHACPTDKPEEAAERRAWLEAWKRDMNAKLPKPRA